MKKTLKLLASIVICEGAGILGSVFTTPAIMGWYATLHKAPFNPPNWVFAPVWTTLFLLMGIALYLVWTKNFKVETSQGVQVKKAWNPISEKLWSGTWKEENAVMIFVLQLVLNILWSVLFFGLRLPAVAFAEILMLWFAILYTIANFYRISKPASYLLLPYLAWVTLASALNLAVFLLN
jgi:translocator protein